MFGFLVALVIFGLMLVVSIRGLMLSERAVKNPRSNGRRSEQAAEANDVTEPTTAAPKR